MADTTNAQTKPLTHDEEAPKNDFMALVRHVQERPMVYLGAIGFVVLILVITGVYRVSQESKMQTASTELVRAQDVTDPAERAAAFGKIADSGSPLAARALYLQGESELEAGDAAKATDAFTKLRQQHPDYEFVPEAVEALGLIKEDAGKFGDARELYTEITTKWADSTAAQRQPFNIARCYEGEKDLPKAIEQYRKQLEVFPGSTIAVRAQGRLDELRAEHPDLFPAEAPKVDTLTTAPATTENAPAAEATPAPAAPAPAAEAPATPAPAETPAPAPADSAAPAPSAPQQ